MEKIIELQKEGEEKNITIARESITIGGGNVNSVNGQTGDVILTTSDIENTSGYQTRVEVASAISDAVARETDARQAADTNLQSQIDGITASSDVTDIVGTYRGLQEYDTTTLSNNDIIKVLQDESQNDETTYYRWSTETQSFTLIGEEGPYYTKSQADTLLNAKQNSLTAGEGIEIANDVISATGSGGGPTVVQTTGTSTTDVMSQDATTKMIYADSGANNLPTKITIGKGANNYASNGIVIGESAIINSSGGVESIAIGHSASIANRETICIGHQARSRGSYNINIGYQAGYGGSSSANYNTYLGYASGGASNSNKYSVALGYASYFTRDGEVNIRAGDTTHGFNNTSYRVLGGVHDGQDAHDAVTVEQVNATIDAINAALSTSIPHIGA